MLIAIVTFYIYICFFRLSVLNAYLLMAFQYI